MKTTLAAATIAAALAAAGAASAQNVAVGAQIGTPGIGATAEYSVSPHVTLRGSLDVLSYDHDVSSDDVDYAGELDWTQGGVFVDVHPTASPFFVSAGAYFGDRTVDLRATANTSAQIGNTVFTPEQIGTLSGEADFGSASGFLGLGWDDTFHTDRQWGFRALVGAQIADSPSVRLARTGGVALPANIQTQLDAELRNEERELQDDLEDFRIYPVVQVGLTYRF